MLTAQVDKLMSDLKQFKADMIMTETIEMMERPSFVDNEHLKVPAANSRAANHAPRTPHNPTAYYNQLISHPTLSCQVVGTSGSLSNQSDDSIATDHGLKESIESMAKLNTVAYTSSIFSMLNTLSTTTETQTKLCSPSPIQSELNNSSDQDPLYTLEDHVVDTLCTNPSLASVGFDRMENYRRVVGEEIGQVRYFLCVRFVC